VAARTPQGRFALEALFQLSCRFIEKHRSYRTNANAGADSRIWRAAAKLISDRQRSSSNGVQAPLRCRQSPDASKPDGCDRQRGHVVGFAGRSASGRFQLRCFGIPIRRQISSACRRELGSDRACQLRSPKEVARNLSFYSDALPLAACIRTLLADRFLCFFKLAPFERT
jgi:hypothetical protein